MTISDRVEATANNIEGKIQEAVGEITGDPQQQAEGEFKQEKAKVQHEVENLKEKTSS
ncbi:MAG: CsbD family protein [Spirulinaceae cyanobacterium]